MDAWIELSNYFSGRAVFINVIDPICTFERIMWRATINMSSDTRFTHVSKLLALRNYKLKQSQHTYIQPSFFIFLNAHFISKLKTFFKNSLLK